MTDTVTLQVPPGIETQGCTASFRVTSEHQVRAWHSRLIQDGVEATIWYLPDEHDAQRIMLMYEADGVSISVMAEMS